MDGTQDHDDQMSRHGTAGLKFRLIACAALGIVVFLAARATVSPGLEWRLLALAALAFALSPFDCGLRVRGGKISVPVAAWHSALFAGAITLGPLGAALPAAFYGSARIIFGRDGSRPLIHVLYAIAKPAVACSMASLAYMLAGGDEWTPQAVNSFIPVMLAGAVYVIAGMALTVACEERVGDDAWSSSAAGLLAGWALTLLGGYTVAVLYAVAPTYVLVCPCAALALVGCALREPRAKAGPVIHESAAVEPSPDPADETNVFVDQATGVANERYLNMFLTRELSRAARVGKTLSVAVFDVDGARKQMAGEGRQSVEDVVVALGTRLKDSVREYDLVARHSPHRLLVVLPEATAEEAYDAVIRLHEQVTSEPINGKPVSVSAGIATFPEHGNTAQELINASHRVLNHGRFMGPNCVHVSHRLERAS